MDLKFFQLKNAELTAMPILTLEGSGEVETLNDAATLAGRNSWPNNSRPRLPYWVSDTVDILTPRIVHRARRQGNEDQANERGLFLYQRLGDYAIHERRSHGDNPESQRIKLSGEEAVAAINALRLFATTSPERVVNWPSHYEVGAIAVGLCKQINAAYENPQQTQDISLI